MEQETKNKEKALTPEAKRLIIIVTAVFVGVVLLFGIVIGTVVAVRNSRAVMIYNGSIIDRGVANYLAMVAKYDFISGLATEGIKCADTEAFWSSLSPSGVSYGALLEKEVEMYLKSVLIGSYLFDKNSSLTKSDREILDGALEFALVNFASDKNALNEEAAKRGFDYSDMKRGAEMIYKYKKAKVAIFGEGDDVLKSGSFDNILDEFYSSYSYAKLLFIRTEDTYATNADTGKKELRDLSDEEKAEVLADITLLKQYIADEFMSESIMDNRITGKYASDDMNLTSGYYFADTSMHTESLNDAYPEVVAKVKEMKAKTFATVDTKWGVCIIYKDVLPTRGYVYPSNDMFFADFYSDAKDYIYLREIIKYSDSVKVNDTFYEIDPASVSYSYKLIARV